MNDVPPEAYEDCFHPPSIPTEVFCLHCHEVYESYLVQWRPVEDEHESGISGFWCCPTPGCDGMGFGMDILPTDSDYIDPDGREMGWCSCDDDEFNDDDDTSEEWDEDDADVELLMDEAVDDALEMSEIGGGMSIPLDDLLPESNETIGLDLTPQQMHQIKQRIGWYEGGSGTASSHQAGRDHREKKDDEDGP